MEGVCAVVGLAEGEARIQDEHALAGGVEGIWKREDGDGGGGGEGVGAEGEGVLRPGEGEADRSVLFQINQIACFYLCI